VFRGGIQRFVFLSPAENLPCGADPGTKAIADAMMAKRVTIWTVFMVEMLAAAQCEENVRLVMPCCSKTLRDLFCSTSGYILSCLCQFVRSFLMGA